MEDWGANPFKPSCAQTRQTTAADQDMNVEDDYSQDGISDYVVYENDYEERLLQLLAKTRGGGSHFSGTSSRPGSQVPFKDAGFSQPSSSHLQPGGWRQVNRSKHLETSGAPAAKEAVSRWPSLERESGRWASLAATSQQVHVTSTDRPAHTELEAVGASSAPWETGPANNRVEDLMRQGKPEVQSQAQREAGLNQTPLQGAAKQQPWAQPGQDLWQDSLWSTPEHVLNPRAAQKAKAKSQLRFRPVKRVEASQRPMLSLQRMGGGPVSMARQLRELCEEPWTPKDLLEEEGDCWREDIEEEEQDEAAEARRPKQVQEDDDLMEDEDDASVPSPLPKPPRQQASVSLTSHFRDVLESAEDPGPPPGSEPQHGRSKGTPGSLYASLQRALQREKAAKAQLEKQALSETDAREFLDVRIINVQPEAHLLRCTCINMQDNERPVNVYFSTKADLPFSIQAGHVVRIHAPWREVGVSRFQEKVVLCMGACSLLGHRDGNIVVR